MSVIESAASAHAPQPLSASPEPLDRVISGLERIFSQALGSLSNQAAALLKATRGDQFAMWTYLQLLGSNAGLAASFCSDLARAESSNSAATAEELSSKILRRYIYERRLPATDAQRIAASSIAYSERSDAAAAAKLLGEAKAARAHSR
jgi:hypothetical protein